MLQELQITKEKFVFKFDLKNKGKFRLKEFQGSGLSSTYSKTVSKEEISHANSHAKWYLEWQISYFTKNKDAPPFLILNNATFETSKGEQAYPFELSVFFVSGNKE